VVANDYPVVVLGSPVNPTTWYNPIAEDLTAVKAVVNDDWVSYTPVWTSSGTAPSLGNGSLTGRSRAFGTSLIICEVRLVFGSTTTGGTGIWFFTLSHTATADAVNLSGGTWHALDVGVQDYGGTTKMDTTTTFRCQISTGNGVGATLPFTFANTDTLRSQVIFESATT